MPLAPELVMPELDAPTEGAYQELLEGHDWETHLPPSPEGRLVRTIDHCPGCGTSVHLLLRREEGAILAARFNVPNRRGHRLFLLERGRMEPATAEACRRALRKFNPAPGPTWHVPVDDDGQPRLEAKYLPLGPGPDPTFRDLVRQHRWKHVQGGAREGEHVHHCSVCHARMSASLDQRGHISRARLNLPAGRECHYLGGENSIRPVTGAEFYGREPLRLSRDQLEAEGRENPPTRDKGPTKTSRTRT